MVASLELLLCLFSATGLPGLDFGMLVAPTTDPDGERGFLTFLLRETRATFSFSRLSF